MKTLAILLFVVGINLGASTECLPSWTSFQGNCYGYGDTVASWPEAQAICQTRGATLAEVYSLQENNFLTAMARNKRAHCVWLGGDDIFHEGTWEWTTASNDFNEFTNWSNGEPNNLRDAEDCLMMFSRHNYGWNDESCRTECNFICSRPRDVIDVVIAK